MHELPATRGMLGVALEAARAENARRILAIDVVVGELTSFVDDAVQFYFDVIAEGTAAVSDGIDGFVARAYNQKTKLGAVLDPAADKLLLNLAFIFLAVNKEFRTPVPGWFAVIMVSRDFIITMGSYLIHEYFGPLRVRPRLLGKLNTALQMSTIVAVLVEWRYAEPVLWTTLVVSLLSLGDYMQVGIRQIGREEEA